MPQTIQCGSCQRHIKLPDGLDTSRQYRCPGCGSPLVIPSGPAEQPINLPMQPAPNYAPAPPSNPLDFSDRNESAGRRDDAPATSTETLDAETRQTLRTGTMLNLIAHGTYLFGLLLTIILFLVAAYSDEKTGSSRKGAAAVEEGKFMFFLSILFLLAMLGQYYVALVGQGFWLAAPWKYGARGLACALTAISLIVLIRQTDFAQLFGSVSHASAGHGRGDEALGALGVLLAPLLLLVVESARLSLIASTTQAIGRNLRRNNPPTAGAGLLALLTPAAIIGAYLLLVLVAMFSDPPSGDEGKTKFVLLVLLILFAMAGVVAWGGLSMFMLMSGLGSRGSKRY
jgi:hypothetical protein